MTRNLSVGVIAMVSVLMLVPVHAQTQRSGSDVNRVVQQLQQVTAEKSRLQQDNDALKKELEDLKAKFTKLSGEQGKLQQKTRELELVAKRQRSGDEDDELQKSRAKMQELITTFRETAQTLKEVETERNTLRSAQAAKERELDACVDKNAKMYLLGGEILDHMENQDFWSAMRKKEPFTAISRTRLENLVDDYRYRVDELKLGTKRVSAGAP